MVAKRVLSLLLCVLLSPVSELLAQSPQQAGQINALLPQGLRNAQPAKVKEEVDWNDLLKTESAGRMRVGLLDGSILSVGSNSELRVVQHDSASQQTALEMGFGKLRSKVVKITQPGGKFEVKTPHAVIGVIGTDFYLDVAPDRTTVICYTGTVSVTPINAAQVLQQQNPGAPSSAQAGTAANNGLHVAAGQMVVVGNSIPPVVKPTPSGEQAASMRSTAISEGASEGAVAASHGLLQVLIGAVAVGAVTGVVVGTTRQNGTPRFFPGPQPPAPKPPVCPPTQCGTPGR
jgi:hypothetical protein